MEHTFQDLFVKNHTITFHINILSVGLYIKASNVLEQGDKI